MRGNGIGLTSATAASGADIGTGLGTIMSGIDIHGIDIRALHRRTRAVHSLTVGRRRRIGRTARHTLIPSRMTFDRLCLLRMRPQ